LVGASLSEEQRSHSYYLTTSTRLEPWGAMVFWRLTHHLQAEVPCIQEWQSTKSPFLEWKMAKLCENPMGPGPSQIAHNPSIDTQSIDSSRQTPYLRASVRAWMGGKPSVATV
jgi:hypothetical protein